MARLLIVEDDKAIRNLIVKNLELIGHSCDYTDDGILALDMISSRNYDLLIFDVMLPNISGFELITNVNETPVIFVTAKDRSEDKIKGLTLGADDYLTKPFEMQELLLRVNAILKRTRTAEKVLNFDDIKIDFVAKRIYKNGLEVILTPKEYLLLETLILNRNIALSRDKLISLVWQFDYDGDTRTVDVHIRQLRLKLGLKNRLKTLYKMGYRFEL